MIALMVAAPQSGSGKTVLTCALLRALQRKGLSVAGFKCGPDYLDPLFHRRVLGALCDNLDLFLQGGDAVHTTIGLAQADVAVIEGAMGLFDGIGGTDEASAWQLAAQEHIPAILAVRPGGSSLTLAAQIQGICAFRKPNVVAGVVLLDCKPKLAAHLTPLIERECAIPVFGYLPPMEEAKFASRHLGLVRAQEVPDFQHRFDVIAATLERTCDLEALLAVAAAVEPAPRPRRIAHDTCRIAVARDEAFCFYYDASLARLTECGAELMAFSPLHDKELPPADGLYLGGGYPELHAIQLAENRSMLRSVRDAVVEGLPTVAECGGFMYLQEELVDKSGRAHRMAGVLPGRSYPAGRLVRFGYAHLAARHDSMLLRAGEQVPAHEFHHWDSTHNGENLVARKLDGTTWKCCHATPTLYAGFPHLHFAGTLPLAERFVQSATKKGRTTQ